MKTRLIILLLLISTFAFGQTAVKELIIVGPYQDTTVTTGTNGRFIHNKTNGKYYFYNVITGFWQELQFISGGGIGGSTGATDNAILRADGTGGGTVQSSTVTISDGGNITTGNTTIGSSLSSFSGTGNLNPVSGDAAHLFEIVNDDSPYQVWRMSTYGSVGLAGQNNMHFVRARGTSGTPSAILSGDFFLSMGFRGFDGTDMTASAGAYQTRATENWTGSAHGLKHRWESTPNGSISRSSFMELDGDGNLSIGGVGSSELRIYEPSGSGTNYNAFKTAAQSADVTYTLPTAAPTSDGQSLVSTTGGVLSWDNPNGEVLMAQVTVSSAQILSSNTTPVQIVAAPGAGKIINLIRATTKLVYNSVAYATNVTSFLVLGTSASDFVTSGINMIGGSTTKWVMFDASSTLTFTSSLENNALNFMTNVGDPTAGNSDMIVTVYYTIVDYN